MDPLLNRDSVPVLAEGLIDRVYHRAQDALVQVQGIPQIFEKLLLVLFTGSFGLKAFVVWHDPVIRSELIAIIALHCFDPVKGRYTCPVWVATCEEAGVGCRGYGWKYCGALSEVALLEHGFEVMVLSCDVEEGLYVAAVQYPEEDLRPLLCLDRRSTAPEEDGLPESLCHGVDDVGDWCQNNPDVVYNCSELMFEVAVRGCTAEDPV